MEYIHQKFFNFYGYYRVIKNKVVRMDRNVLVRKLIEPGRTGIRRRKLQKISLERTKHLGRQRGKSYRRDEIISNGSETLE